MFFLQKKLLQVYDNAVGMGKTSRSMKGKIGRVLCRNVQNFYTKNPDFRAAWSVLTYLVTETAEKWNDFCSNILLNMV